jgi:solute carrier family 25 uncoupling protein 27
MGEGPGGSAPLVAAPAAPPPPPWRKLSLSAAAAGVAESATYPLDFLKTRLQLDQAARPRNLVATAAAVLRHEGASAAYAGLPAAVARHIPYTSIRVSTFETLRNWGRERVGGADGAVPLPWALLCGLTAGGLGQVAAVPADLVKIRMQRDPGRYRGLIDAFQRIYREEGGASALWRGSLPAVQRAALVNLGELSTYDAAKRAVLDSGATGGRDGVGAHVLASMCSGLVSAAVSTPADVVKTRLMSQDPAKPQYRGMADCFLATLRGEGVRGLYKGFLPTWARLGPWQLTFWLTYEQLRRLQGLPGF